MSQSYLCGNCGDVVRRNDGNLPTDGRPVLCRKPECRAVHKKLDLARRREQYKPEQPFKPPVICDNCGEEIQKRSGRGASRVLPPHCKKAECRVAFEKLRQERRKDTDKDLPSKDPFFKTPEPYDPVEFNALGEAVNPDIFQKLVDGNGRNCDDCRWNDNCRERVKLGLFLACESPARHERELVERNPEMMIQLVKLSTVVIG